MDNFYEFDHECDKMPDGVSFCKVKSAASTQFTSEKYISNTCLFSTTLYGFKYCPYCGEKVDD